MNAKNFSERLDFAISKFGNIGDMMVRATNLSYTTIARWKEGSDPKMSNLVALSKVADINLHWLLTGEGEPNNNPAPIVHKADTDENASQYYYIPYYRNIVASAGNGRFSDGVIDTDDFLAFSKEWVHRTNLDPTQLVVLSTQGNSMLPTIPENATIVVDKSKNIAKDGRIYVVCVNDRLYIKRTQWIPIGGLRLISDNPIYKTLT